MSGLEEFMQGVNDHLDRMDNGGGEDPKKAPPTKLHIDDKRKRLAATNVEINKNKDLKSGDYDLGTIRNIIKAAKHNGVDPYTALAVGLQETHLGKLNPDNLGNVYAVYPKIPEGLDRQSYEMTAFLKEKMTEGKKLGFKDENMLIQMYNGLGKLKPTEKVNGKSVPQKFYGIEVTDEKPLDLRKNPLYGKTVIDLRDNVLKQNEELQKIVQDTK